MTVGTSFRSLTKQLQAESAAAVKSKGGKKRESSTAFEDEKSACMQFFEKWSEQEQVEFVENLLARMCHYQHGQVNTFLKPMLQRDFISALPGELNCAAVPASLHSIVHYRVSAKGPSIFHAISYMSNHKFIFFHD